jgi:double-stranded uracil-DNA glycosylase
VHCQLLKDRIRTPVRVLLVGINPGVRSSQVGHHFAGPSNRFWKLLYRLPEWGFGMTNLIPRPTPGIDTLRAEEYVAGAKALRRKVRRLKPAMVAFIGVTLFRSLFNKRPGEPVATGPQDERFEGVRVFVLPNPSGRNANFSYAEMLDAFTRLRRALDRLSV